MKLFQITHKYNPYIAYFENKFGIKDGSHSFEEMKTLLINEGFYGPHILKPIFDGDKNSFYTMWDYERLQLQWAKENNIPTTDLLEILKAQIISFSPDVIYNMSSQMIDFEDLRQCSNTAKIVAWNADPGSIHINELDKYEILFTSSINKINQSQNTHLQYPSVDKIMLNQANQNKEVDIFFYGQYDGTPFQNRRKYIKELLPFFEKNNISYYFALMYNKTKKIKYNIPYIRRFDFAKEIEPPKYIEERVKKPIFGEEIYKMTSKAKIVFNISAEAENFADFKFNMRIFETLGVGSFMLSDEGKYPPHIIDGEDFVSYKNIEDLKSKILYYLKNDDEREKIAQNGNHMVKKYYSKEQQWKVFKDAIEKL